MLEPKVIELASKPNYAHFATLMPDGSPQVSAVWIGVDGEHLVVYKGEDTAALKNVRRDPRVAISVVEFDNPYAGMRIRGSVVEMRGEPDAAEWLDARAAEYTGQGFPKKHLEESNGVLLLISPVSQNPYSSPMRHRVQQED